MPACRPRASRSDCISRSRESFSRAAANGSSSSCTRSRCVCEKDRPAPPTIRIRPSGVPSSLASGPTTISASRVRDATRLAGSSPNQRRFDEDPTATPAWQLVTLPSSNHSRSSISSVSSSEVFPTAIGTPPVPMPHATVSRHDRCRSTRRIANASSGICSASVGSRRSTDS